MTLVLQPWRPLASREDGRKQSWCYQDDTEITHRRPPLSPFASRVSGALPPCVQVLLMPPKEELQRRVAARWAQGGHFMPPSLLGSQLDALSVRIIKPATSRDTYGPARCSGCRGTLTVGFRSRHEGLWSSSLASRPSPRLRFVALVGWYTHVSG